MVQSLLLTGNYIRVVGLRRSLCEYMMIPHIPCIVATLLGKCEDIPDNPTISKTQNGSALTCPVVFGVNQTVSIWCKAENMNGSRKLQGLFWRDNNGSRVYSKGHSNNSNPDVYSVQNAGNVSNFTSTRIWIRALHFSRIQPSYAGTYKCTANYNKLFVNETVEVRIEGWCQ